MGAGAAGGAAEAGAARRGGGERDAPAAGLSQARQADEAVAILGVEQKKEREGAIVRRARSVMRGRGAVKAATGCGGLAPPRAG